MASRFFYRTLQKLQNLSNQLRPASSGFGDEAFFSELTLLKMKDQMAAAGLDDSGLQILDAGCGLGSIALPLAEAGHRVTGIEIHKQSLEQARKLAGGQNLELDLIHAELLEELPRHADGRYDVVICIAVLYTCPDYREILAHLANALKPGGLMFATFRTPFYFITSLLRQQRYEEAVFVSKEKEGVLRLASVPCYYNWQTPDEVSRLYSDLGLEMMHLGPHGLFTGVGRDGMAAVADIGAIPEKLVQSSIRELERQEYEGCDGVGRYTLATGKRVVD